jgi:uncharacterized protein YgbK (DUF1537 family)
MAKIGAIADDLTGATTVGVLLARAGIKTAAFFKYEDLASAYTESNHEAIIVSTDSRPLPREEAMKRVRSAAAALKEMGIKQFSKRTDTTLRGGIGAEIDAMLDELGQDTVAVMVPAMPQSNRIMVGGYSIINSVLLSRTPVASDVRTPVRDSFVPRLMANQTKRQIGHVCLDQLFKGKENLQNAMSVCRGSGAEIILVDAASMEDIEMIAQVVVDLQWNVLAVDPGPFTERLAKVRGWTKEDTTDLIEEEANASDCNKGTILVAAGSASPVTATQMGVLKDVTGACQVSVKAPLLVMGGEVAAAEVERAAKLVAEAMNTDNPPNVVLIETALSYGVLNLSEMERRHGLQSGEAAGNINSGLGKIVSKVLDHAADKIAGLYTTGGDIMVNVCSSLGVSGIELIDYVIPQADLGRLIGSKYDSLPIVGKGGLTGNDHTAVDCVNRLFKESRRNVRMASI